MAIVSNEKMKMYAKKYNFTKDVTAEDCYIGGKNCGTCRYCMYSQSSDMDDICTCSERETE